MIPKHKRIVNKKLINEMSGGICEKCGRPAHGQPHHIITVGAGGPDIKENLIQLSCSNGCHIKAHSGEITRDELLFIVARRENITVEECERCIQLKRGIKYEM